MVSFFKYTLSVLNLIAIVAGQDKVVVGYWSEWTAQEYPVSAVPWDLLTHVNYAFATIDFDTWLPKIQNPEALKELVSKAKATNTKVLLSVGGGGDGSKYFSVMANQDYTRTLFAGNLAKIIRQYGLDGVDIDWEFPGREGSPGNSHSPSDTDNYSLFLARLKRFINGGLITAAVRVEPFDGPNGPLESVAPFASLFDFINIMAYDINGPWSPETGPLAPLENEPGKGVQYSVKQSTSQWNSAGIPKDKIVLGVPFYYYPLEVQQDMSQSDSQYAAVSNNNLGSYGFNQLINGNILSSPMQANANNGWIRKFDKVSKTPWLFNKESKTYISYDDTLSLSFKTEYVRCNGYKGVMAWALNNDYNSILLKSLQNVHSTGACVEIPIPTDPPVTTTTTTTTTSATTTTTKPSTSTTTNPTTTTTTTIETSTAPITTSPATTTTEASTYTTRSPTTTTTTKASTSTITDSTVTTTEASISTTSPTTIITTETSVSTTTTGEYPVKTTTTGYNVKTTTIASDYTTSTGYGVKTTTGDYPVKTTTVTTKDDTTTRITATVSTTTTPNFEYPAKSTTTNTVPNGEYSVKTINSNGQYSAKTTETEGYSVKTSATTTSDGEYPVKTTTTTATGEYPVETTTTTTPNGEYPVKTTTISNVEYPVKSTTTSTTPNDEYPIKTTTTLNGEYPVKTTETKAYPVKTTTTTITSNDEYPVKATATIPNNRYPDKTATIATPNGEYPVKTTETEAYHVKTTTITTPNGEYPVKTTTNTTPKVEYPLKTTTTDSDYPIKAATTIGRNVEYPVKTKTLTSAYPAKTTVISSNNDYPVKTVTSTITNGEYPFKVTVTEAYGYPVSSIVVANAQHTNTIAEPAYITKPTYQVKKCKPKQH